MISFLKKHRYNPVIKHRNHVRDFCITANYFSEVHNCNAHSRLKVPFNINREIMKDFMEGALLGYNIMVDELSRSYQWLGSAGEDVGLH